MPVDVAHVHLWDKTIGAVSWDADRQLAAFEYTKAFQENGLELAPLRMPLGPTIYSFPELARSPFNGLPGLLADSLPDKFGNLLINAWLVREGRQPNSFSPVERLCYIGVRGMGALEFHPAQSPHLNSSNIVDVGRLVALASQALSQKQTLNAQLSGDKDADTQAMRDILRVGTSAGGARAKAVIAFNESTNQVRSGQVKAPSGFSYWLLKLDGVSNNKDKEVADPQGYGKIEYAYSLMARKAGVEMTECRLLHENNRSHFMTRRFDRTDVGEKLFVQSLCAVDHMDFNQAGAYSYEQALEVALRLGVSPSGREQLFRRMVFNILSRNQDDHTKNISFLMDKTGSWSLAPAYDVVFSYNPEGAWTSRHQMTLNGKQDHFALDDFAAAARRFRLFKGSRLSQLLDEVDQSLANWPSFAASAEVPEPQMRGITRHHRRLRDLK